MYIGGNGHQTRGWGFWEFIHFRVQCPKHQTQARGGRFQQKRHENGELSEPDTMFAQGGTRILIQGFDLIGHVTTLDNSQGFDQAERKTTGKTGQGFVALKIEQRLKQGRNLAVDEMLQTARDLLRNICASFFINKCRDLWA